jgi:hypothetical protein
VRSDREGEGGRQASKFSIDFYTVEIRKPDKAGAMDGQREGEPL